MPHRQQQHRQHQRIIRHPQHRPHQHIKPLLRSINHRTKVISSTAVAAEEDVDEVVAEDVVTFKDKAAVVIKGKDVVDIKHRSSSSSSSRTSK